MAQNERHLYRHFIYLQYAWYLERTAYPVSSSSGLRLAMDITTGTRSLSTCGRPMPLGDRQPSGFLGIDGGQSPSRIGSRNSRTDQCTTSALNADISIRLTQGFFDCLDCVRWRCCYYSGRTNIHLATRIIKQQYSLQKRYSVGRWINRFNCSSKDSRRCIKMHLETGGF